MPLLPARWASATIGALCADRVQQATPSSEFIYVDIGSVDNLHKCISSPSNVAADDAPSRARQILRTNDVIVSLTRPNLNAVAIVPAHLDGAIASTGFDVLRSCACEPGWLFAYVQSTGFVSKMTDLVQGALYPAVRPRDVRECEIPLPPAAEQRRVLAKLEALRARGGRARQALDAVPPLLEKLRQSILAAAFRGDLTKDWRAAHPEVQPGTELLKRIRAERRKKWEETEIAKLTARGKAPTDDRWKAKYEEPNKPDLKGLPELPDGWCWAHLGELAHVGTGATPKRSDARFYDGGSIPWITSGALNDEKVAAATEHVTETAIRETNLTVYPPGTLLLAMYGEGKTRGMVAELGIDAATNQAIAAICLEDSALCLKTLIRLALAKNYASIRSVSMGGVQPNLNLEKVRHLAIPLCPPQEARALQVLLTRELGRVTTLLELVTEQAQACDTLTQSILAKAFRGELVPQDPNDEPADVMLARLRESAVAPEKPKRARRSKAAE